jgi:predicted Zn-dependent protease
VHTGILKITQSEDELAAIMGHELSHVTYQHGGQRISQGALVSAAGQAVELYMSRDGEPPNQAVVAALGVAGQVGVVLPFSRKHETEADKQGQKLMARAGYNPEAAASLWRNMMAANGGKAPPEWMSTHPDSENRMERLSASAPDLQALAETARGMGKGRPCK